ncbi:MAG TPA: NAD(P)-dependent oxidoreductase [Steroidobacteraceae bacterium]
MRLLVTGATGFVGSRLALEAARRGHEVTATGRASRGKIVSDLLAAGVRFTPGDLTDEAFAIQVTRGVSHVCHLAAAWREASAPPELFDKVNVRATLGLARAAAANNVAVFVFCSTIGVHARSAREPIREDSSFDATNAYETSKLHTEEQLGEFATRTSMRIAILRPADAYGPGDTRLLKLFRSVEAGRFPLVGSGKGRRHMLFVDDLVDAFLAACEGEFTSGEVFIIAGPESTTLLELLNRLARMTGSRRFGFRVPGPLMVIAAALIEDGCRLLNKAPPLHRRTLDFYRTDVIYDTDKAQRTLRWKPQVGLAEGLQRTLDWYRERGLMPRPHGRPGRP